MALGETRSDYEWKECDLPKDKKLIGFFGVIKESGWCIESLGLLLI